MYNETCFLQTYMLLKLIKNISQQHESTFMVSDFNSKWRKIKSPETDSACISMCYVESLNMLTVQETHQHCVRNNSSWGISLHGSHTLSQKLVCEDLSQLFCVSDIDIIVSVMNDSLLWGWFRGLGQKAFLLLPCLKDNSVMWGNLR